MTAKPTATAKTGAGRRPLAALVSIGPKMIHYDVDVDAGTLIERDSLTFTENIQFAWPHADRDHLYVASSNRSASNGQHHVSAVRIDPITGALSKHGESHALASRPIHITTDIPSQYILNAYSDPSGLTVHRINPDGTIGDEVNQSPSLTFGIYSHEVRVDPANKTVILVTRGHDAENGKPEEPGALKLFDYDNGVLTPQATIAPDDGFGFGPRDIDFHPTLPRAFLALERQNKLYTYARNKDGGLEPNILYNNETLADPSVFRHRQMVGTLHVHPNGKFLYVANRALGLAEFQGKRVSEGETSIAVYMIDQATGEPTKIQDAEVHGAHPRTFAIDPTGTLLIAANSTPLAARVGDKIETAPANVALFRIGDDGKLTYLRRYDFPDATEDVFWVDLVG